MSRNTVVDGAATKPLARWACRGGESEGGDAAGDGDAVGDEDGSARRCHRRRRGRGGGAVEGGTTRSRSATGRCRSRSVITGRPTMDRLVRVRFMALAPTTVRRLRSVDQGPPRPRVHRPTGSRDTSSMANVADRLTGLGADLRRSRAPRDPGDDRRRRRPRLVPVCFVLAADLCTRRSTRSPSGWWTRAVSPGSATSSSCPRRPWSIAGTRTGRASAGSASTGRAGSWSPTAVEEHAAAVAALRAKYPQYEQQDLDGRPIIRIAIDRVVSWGDTTP